VEPAEMAEPNNCRANPTVRHVARTLAAEAVE
jgi:hypothetical protein